MKIWSSLAYNTSARHEQHECNTSATLVTRVWREWVTSDTSATQVQHECYTNDTSATRVLHDRHKRETSEKFSFW